ncbi:MAG: hypothetical protein ACYCQI_09750 [Gammaproteobacteria bacterium]
MQRLFGKKDKNDDAYVTMPDENKAKQEFEAAKKLAEANAKKASEAKAREEEIERQKQEKENNGCSEEELVAASLLQTNWWKGYFAALPKEDQFFMKLGRDGFMEDTKEIAKSTEVILSKAEREALNEQRRLVAEAERRIKEAKKQLFIASLVDAGLLNVTVAAPAEQTIQQEQESENSNSSPRYRSL